MAKEIKFKREYYLHMITQKHLKCLFDLELLASEIQHEKLRFDNLAFDEKTNSFVIIEYKNSFSKNVLKQVKSYSNLIQKDDNRQYFKNRLNKKTKIVWDTTRIMIIGPKFSQDQIDKAKNNDFELWKVTLFDDCKVTYENLNTNKIKTLKIKAEDLKITEEELLENKSNEMKNLYENFKENLKNEFNDVEIKCLVNQFAIRFNGSLLCLVEFLKSSFNVYFYADKLKNADKTIEISKKSTGGKAKYKLKYNSNDDFDYFLELFKQTYSQKSGKNE